jgi:hypothetical protein
MQLLSLTKVVHRERRGVDFDACFTGGGWHIDTHLVHQRFGGLCSDCRVQRATERTVETPFQHAVGKPHGRGATTSWTATEGRRRLLDIREKDAVIVDAMNPHVTVQVADQPGLREVADDTAHQLIPPPRRTSCGGSSRSSD